MLLALLSACSPFEGSWFLVPDYTEYDRSGDCDDDDVSIESNEGEFVDIYRLGDGQLSVIMGEALVGTAESGELVAAFDEVIEADIGGDDYSIEDHALFTATVEGDVMTGVYETDYREEYGSADYSCSTELPFSAYRSLSARGAYLDEATVETSE